MRGSIAPRPGVLPRAFCVLFKPAQVLPYSTNNARFEELAEKASYKRPWANAQRCLIPAIAFDEPCWESGKNIWWQFKRRDGALWGLAGLWNTWTDHATGELHESYTMLTVNADSHPLMNRMHKPDPKYAHNEQDKRSVVSIERHESDQWRASLCGCTTPTGCHVY